MLSNSHWFTPFQKLFLLVCLVSAVGCALFFIRDLMLPFLLSFVLSYLLTPLVDRLEFVVKKRVFAVSLLFLVFFLLLGFAIIFMLPIITKEVTDLYQNAPVYLDNSKKFLTGLQYSVEQNYPLLVKFDIIDQFITHAQRILMNLAKDIPNIVLAVVSVLSYLALVPIILFFFLLQGPDMKKQALEIIPNRYFETVLNLQHKISSQLGNYLRGILIEALIVAGLSGGFLLLLGVDYALIIGAVAGICNLIPYLGPVSGAIPAMIVFYLKMGTINSIITIVILFGIVQFIDNMLVQPIIYSQSIDLHPLMVMFAVIIGGTFGGLWGLVLAVPITGVIKVVSHEIFQEIKFRNQHRLENTSG